ncbi:hypothetical protein [Chromobacterium phragmitis]|uniref:Peptidase C39-like domain-containing protein n=1 Tax=Chromobacterium phragmitis TaxID=2202141 RepID=A0ABV0IVH7_9NEIS
MQLIVPGTVPCTIQQPDGSLLCGAYAVAMSLNALGCDLTADIDISYNPGPIAKFTRDSTIRGNDNFHGVAAAIYQVTGYLGWDVVINVLPATYCGLNGLAGMLRVLKDVEGTINIDVTYTAIAKGGFDLTFPGEFGRVTPLVNSITQVPAPMPAVIQNDQVVIALFDNGGGGNHWVVFSDTDSYDPATGDEVDETGPYNRGNALVAVLLEK